MHHSIQFFVVAMLTTAWVNIAAAENILILPFPSMSYLNREANLAQELKSRNHNVTMIVPGGLIKDRLLTEFHIDDIDVIVSEGMNKALALILDLLDSLTVSSFQGSKLAIFNIIWKARMACSYVVQDEELLQALKNGKFDIAIIDTISNTCFSVIPYKLSIPFIQQERLFHKIRGLIHPAAHPALDHLVVIEKLSFVQRMLNTAMLILLHFLPSFNEPVDVTGTFAPEKPHITNDELQAKTKLYLIEMDELIDTCPPTFRNMIYVGGLSTRPARELKGDLKVFMDSADYGAVIVSMGSLLDNRIPRYIVEKLMDAFRRHPRLKFVFKYGAEPNILGNIMQMPWIPQNDLLGHPNTKLFISHCGLNAIYEALYNAVPILGLPIVGDGHSYAFKIQTKGYGLYLDVNTLTENDLEKAIAEMLETPSYKYNIMKASAIFKNRPYTPAQRAAFWVDHVIQYGGDHLRSPLATLPNYQFLLLDVIVGSAVFVVILCVLCCLSIRCIIQAVRSSKQKRD